MYIITVYIIITFNNWLLYKYIYTVVARPTCSVSHIAPYLTITIVLSLMQLYQVYNVNQRAIQATNEHHLCEDSDSRNVANV